MTLEILLILSSGTLGIFLGAQLAEAVLFVPYWKALSAEDFFKFYEKIGKKLHQFFAPLTILATVFPLLTVVYCWINQAQEVLLITVMGLSTLLFFSTFYLYFKQANLRFTEKSLSDQELAKELIRWGNWHWGRIFFELIAFTCALLLLLKI